MSENKRHHWRGLRLPKVLLSVVRNFWLMVMVSNVYGYLARCSIMNHFMQNRILI